MLVGKLFTCKAAYIIPHSPLAENFRSNKGKDFFFNFKFLYVFLEVIYFIFSETGGKNIMG